MPRVIIVSCFTSFLVMVLQTVNAFTYRPICRIDNNPLEVLELDTSTGKIYRIAQKDNDDKQRELNDILDESHSTSFLRKRSHLDDKETNEYHDLQDYTTWSRGLQIEDLEAQYETNFSERIRFEARRCDCQNDFSRRRPVYCPAAVKHCGAPWGRNAIDEPLGCFTPTRKGIYTLSLLMYLSMAWVVGLLAWIFGSVGGKHVRDFLMGCIIPQWNKKLADHILQRDPARAFRMMRRQLRLQAQQELSPDWNRDAQAVRSLVTGTGTTSIIVKEKNSPTSLILKTRHYSTRKHSGDNIAQDNEDDSVDCMICFQEIMDGTRIGDLSCGHIYHSDCLKKWCRRKNRCPVCQCENIAEAQFDNETPVTNLVPDESNSS